MRYCHPLDVFLDLVGDLGIVRFGQGFDAIGKFFDRSGDLFVMGQQELKDFVVFVMSFIRSVTGTTRTTSEAGPALPQTAALSEAVTSCRTKARSETGTLSKPDRGPDPLSDCRRGKTEHHGCRDTDVKE